MCGICGYISLDNDNAVHESVLKNMCRTMRHRGPDDEGYYVDANAGIGMRRLSIIDLSTGHQPITNEDGSLWIVFNGEIYNYRELRNRLESKGHRFSTQTDTEAIVHAYEEYGEDCVTHLNGMFGFAIWDKNNRRLFLARDRLGIKPMYYWVSGDRLYFGSELKAVIAHPDVPRELNPIALNHFLTLEYIPAPWTILKDVKKLPAGHTLTFQKGKCDIKQYWDIGYQQMPKTDEECIEALTSLIKDAVNLRLVSDVPLGAFLSGGIDSSTIVSFMSELMSEPVKTFSIGFGDRTYNELPYARAVAAHFGTDHYEEFLEPDILPMVERLVGHLDEPFGDFSIFPTYLVSEVARRHVTVVLSGDGGDELFGGYDTYIAQSYADRYYQYLPRPIRQGVLPALMDKLPPQPAKKGLINKAKRFVEGGALSPSLQHTRWMTFMNDKDKNQLFNSDFRLTMNGNTPAALIENYFSRVSHLDPLAQQQYVDVKTYLVDDILTKVDRMSMAPSIEARVPLLDHRIVEFALNLPPHLKMNSGRTKVILRKIVENRLPDVILNKPKEGFSIPIKHWLRGPLNPLMMDLLSPDTIKQRNYFQPQCVAGWIDEHLNSKANHSHRLWALMVFELWHRQALDNVNVAEKESI
ncbi:MAG: asparagine synthase (glutamine-hydrolyzing) [Anaerolineae bacterium]|nr:asparagine synthase (glutamine-hydrolyzing) [Anaerolineae bacterium]